MKTYLLQPPTLGGFGEYSYKSLTVDEARKILSERGFISGIRYQWDSDILRDLLGLYIPINRGEIKMEVGGAAVVEFS